MPSTDTAGRQTLAKLTEVRGELHHHVITMTGISSDGDRYRYRYRYLMCYAQSTAKGHIRVKQNVFLPHVNILIHYLTCIHSTVHNWRHLGKMRLNEPGRQTLGR